MSNSTPDRTERFEIRLIDWSEYNFQSPTLLQDENGPCPLISLINTLILNFEVQNKEVVLDGKELDKPEADKHEAVKALKELLLRKEKGPGFIELEETLAQLGNLLLEFIANKDGEYDVDSLLKSLPELHTGLSVNPNLQNGKFPSNDLSTQLFEIFGLKFTHGWCFGNKGILPNTGSHASANISSSSFVQLETFDEIQDYLLRNISGEGNEEQKQSLKENQNIISQWLDTNKTQLTSSGLEKLNNYLELGEFVVFFRNNHFNTLLKRSDMEFYLLITDTSFKSSKVVWQSLNSVNGGDDLFFNGEFQPIFNIEDVQELPENDYTLIKKLQEEEDARIARKMNDNFIKKQKDQEQKNSNRSTKKDKKNSNSTKEKKKSNCCIM